MTIDAILKIEPYSLKKVEKEAFFNSSLADLSQYHYQNCEPYRKIIDALDLKITRDHLYTEIPFLPTQLFKTNQLKSNNDDRSLKKISSSGTSGTSKTTVYLDKENAINQSKVLSKIVASFLGNKRLPAIILDTESALSDRDHLSARAAGLIGFSAFGTKRIFALNKKMELNIDLIESFLEQHRGERIFMFGFTFLIYEHFYKTLLRSGKKLDLSNAILIHGGGWKKMQKEAISQREFKSNMNQICGIKHIYDYYGMAEQTGSIFMQCEFGHYHASLFSNVVIRRALDFSEADKGEEGIIQVLSLLPKSYPGHSLLTDDLGILLGEDDCACKRFGKYFKITGRVKKAALRGCSDTYD